MKNMVILKLRNFTRSKRNHNYKDKIEGIKETLETKAMIKMVKEEIEIIIMEEIDTVTEEEIHMKNNNSTNSKKMRNSKSNYSVSLKDQNQNFQTHQRKMFPNKRKWILQITELS
jgi:hypothetical protein